MLMGRFGIDNGEIYRRLPDRQKRSLQEIHRWYKCHYFALQAGFFSDFFSPPWRAANAWKQLSPAIHYGSPFSAGKDNCNECNFHWNWNFILFPELTVAAERSRRSERCGNIESFFLWHSIQHEHLHVCETFCGRASWKVASACDSFPPSELGAKTAQAFC